MLVGLAASPSSCAALIRPFKHSSGDWDVLFLISAVEPGAHFARLNAWLAHVPFLEALSIKSSLGSLWTILSPSCPDLAKLPVSERHVVFAAA